MDAKRREFMFGRFRNERGRDKADNDVRTSDGLMYNFDGGIDRRRFLKEGIKAACIGFGVNLELPKTDELSFDSAEEKGEYKELHDFLYEFINIANGIKERIDGLSYNFSSIEEIDQARRILLSKISADRIKRGLDLAYKFKNVNYLFPLYIVDTLVMFDSIGIYYDYLRSKNRYNNRHDPLSREYIPLLSDLDNTNHYYARVSDFCPRGEEVADEEIDPRLRFTVGSVEQSLRYEPAWARPEWQNEFRSVINNKHVRNLLENTNCTLAEAYSLIKAAVKYKKEHPNSRINYDVIMAKLLHEREKFMKHVFIGPETDEFIHFNYVPKTKDEAQFDGDYLDMLSGRLMVRKRSDGKFERPDEVKKRIKRVDSSEDFAGLEMRKRIWESSGKTTIYFNTHGSPFKLRVKEGEKYGISPGEVAMALIVRLRNSGDPNDLANVNLIFASCYSYDFVKNFEARLRESYEDFSYSDSVGGEEKTCAEVLGVPFSKIKLPTVVAAAQQGSLSYTLATDYQLKDKLYALMKENKLTGEFYSRRIQPAVYGLADITFFSGEKDGKILEIGMSAVEELDEALA